MGDSTHASKPCTSVSSTAASSAVAGLRNSATHTTGTSPSTGPTYGIILVKPYSADRSVLYGSPSAASTMKHSTATTSDSNSLPTRYFENMKSRSCMKPKKRSLRRLPSLPPSHLVTFANMRPSSQTR